MAKYEIMLVLAPTEELSFAEKIAKDVFGEGVKKVEKLERTELAYEINKSKTGAFVVISVEAEENTIAEFTRRTNIQKTIWRTLVINLDSERGLNRKAKPKRKKLPLRPRTNSQTSEQRNSSAEAKVASSEDKEKKVTRKPRVKKSEQTEAK
ncbi:30S ribosomal protein S6 [Mycoplasma procyoni]|uniref:30S ribosomal protein S6 n=1 Tax=Mycoplasma procyoni TaxID=568784 RepID=UPI00197B9B01|nr:30S ribosomal protein S6 [Mycoplasma procyoni]MBN3534655.1 30S ribosomal protein S6 [Mycoplasma procyoni]